MDLQKCIQDMVIAAEHAGHLALAMRDDIVDLGKEVGTDLYNATVEQNKTALTSADFTCQKEILKMLLPHKECGMYAEEHREDLQKLAAHFSHIDTLLPGKWTFIVDPIDGTRNYVNKGGQNAKKYGVSVALAFGMDVVAGVLHFPEMEKTVVSARDQGTTINGKRVHLARKEHFSFDDPIRISGSAEGDFHAFKSPLSSGSAAYNQLALLEQVVDAYYVRSIDLLDFGATAVAYEKAGGYFGGRDSEPLKLPDLLITVDGCIQLKGFMLFANNSAYHKELARHLE
jgi:fructose-1,6-bisphosphatase/inositol monophosphatase family enzyme